MYITVCLTLSVTWFFFYLLRTRTMNWPMIILLHELIVGLNIHSRNCLVELNLSILTHSNPTLSNLDLNQFLKGVQLEQPTYRCNPNSGIKLRDE